MVEGGERRNVGVKNIDGMKPAVQLLIKGDPHFFGGVEVCLPDVVHNDHGMKVVDLHFPVYIPQKAAAALLQPSGIPGDDLLCQQLGNCYRPLGDQGADFGFALHPNEFV